MTTTRDRRDDVADATGGPPGSVHVGGRGELRSALRWAFALSSGEQVIALIVMSLLAALLGPRAFGIVAMANVFVLFMKMLMQQGLLPALVQREHLEPEHLDTSFVAVAVAGLTLGVLAAVSAPWWAVINRTPELNGVIVALAFVLPLKALAVVPEAIARRAMDFRLLAIRTNTSAVAGGIVGIAMALAGFGVWSLVAQQLVAASVELVVLWWGCAWRPTGRVSWTHLRQLLSFSVGSTMASVGVYVNGQSDALMIGLFFGPTAVGLYRFALRLVDALVRFVVSPIQSVALPSLAALQSDRRRLSDRFTELAGLSGLVLIPALGVLAAVSRPLLGLFGEEWELASDALLLLCLVAVTQSFVMLSGPGLQAVGRPHVLAVISWTGGAASAASFVGVGLLLRDATLATQVSGIAGSRVLLYWLVNLPITLLVLRRYVGTGVISVGSAYMPSFLAGTVAFGLGRWALSLMPTGASSTDQFLMVTAVAGVGGALVLALARDRVRSLARLVVGA